jgi:hypothetical protein
MDNAAAEGKNQKLVVADVMANLYLSIPMPNYSDPINKYWEFNSKLDSLILTRFSIRSAVRICLV